MRTYSEYLTIHTKQPREFRPITQEVKAALRKSECTEGLALITALHANAAVILGLDEPAFFEDLENWLSQLAPLRDDYRLGRAFESNAGTILRALLVHPQIAVPIAEGRLELGPWQEILYLEFDGQRPKRVAIKILGD
jgi:secondary thiamine-phosphate synthase enzyme